MAELWVGAKRAYGHLKDAIAASKDGDTIYVEAGTYQNDFSIIKTDIRIIGVGGTAKLKATVAPDNGKAILVTKANVTIENLEFSGSQVKDGNGAGIRYSGGELTVRNSVFNYNENGILAAGDPNGRIVIEGSEFGYNGTGDGRTHGLYVNKIASLEVSDSIFHETTVGHNLKSRAAETIIDDSRFYDGPGGTASRQIDLPNGGQVTITDSYIYKGVKAEQNDMIGFGQEGARPNSKLTIIDTDFISDKPGKTIAVNNVGSTFVVLGPDNIYDDITTIVTGAHQNGPASPPPSTPVPPVGVSWLYGTDFAEVLSGSSKADQISGKQGDDTIYGLAGGDTIHGDDGNDFLFGGADDDVLWGLDGSDQLNGDDGDDLLIGHLGFDTLRGGAGEDRLIGGGSGDALIGGADADIFAFTTIGDSDATQPYRDVITDFNRAEGDLIDMSAFTGTLTFRGGARFSGAGKEVRFGHQDGDTFVHVDLNGDQLDDLVIRLTGTVQLTARDFDLV